MLALAHYAKGDERIDFFKHFIGYQEQHPYSREILEFYLRLIKSSNESVNHLMALPTDTNNKTASEKVYIDFASAYEKYLNILNNSSNTLKVELKKQLIYNSEILIEGQPRLEVKLNEKWELYAMLLFSKNLMKD